MATTSTAMPRQAMNRPVAPTSMMPISAAFTMRMIRALSRMSASWPDSAESRKKGRMNTAEAMAENRASAASEWYTV